jgi:Zn-dependent M28 family amino/carboxypeptidase
METWGSRYWPVFLIVSSAWLLTGFGIPELIALFASVSTHTDNTLSNYSHVELHVTSTMTIHTVAWYLSLAVWLMATIILTFHIWFDLGG